uniref:Uncharacterized protein n=1 Tax=Vitis vinifera TaxID=29760 RepID=F6HJB5_VITVI
MKKLKQYIKDKLN